MSVAWCAVPVQVACSGNHSAEPSEAQALLEWAKDSNVLVRLLKCAEEPLDPSAGDGSASLPLWCASLPSLDGMDGWLTFALAQLL